MKSRAHWPVSHMFATLSVAAFGVLCFAGVSAAAPTTPALPDGGNGPAISLATSDQEAFIGESVTLTAIGNLDVGETPYWITIYSETTGAEVALCPVGTTCSATVGQNRLGSQTFEAFIGDDVVGDGHPGFVVASSNEVSVVWWRYLPPCVPRFCS